MDYKRMYAVLYGAILDVLNLLPVLPENGQARWELEQALRITEDLCTEEQE